MIQWSLSIEDTLGGVLYREAVLYSEVEWPHNRLSVELLNNKVRRVVGMPRG